MFDPLVGGPFHSCHGLLIDQICGLSVLGCQSQADVFDPLPLEAVCCSLVSRVLQPQWVPGVPLHCWALEQLKLGTTRAQAGHKRSSAELKLGTRKAQQSSASRARGPRGLKLGYRRLQSKEDSDLYSFNAMHCNGAGFKRLQRVQGLGL